MPQFTLLVFTMIQTQLDEAQALEAQLQHQIDRLLEQFDSHQIARCLQRSHNALPDDQRQGYRMEIRLLSLAYQQGGYDTCY